MADLRWSLAAERDLRLLEEFIAHESPLRAVAFVDRLIQSAEILRSTPQLGRSVPEFDRPEVRELIFRGYRVVYVLDASVVTIARVVHGARDLASLVNRDAWNLS